MADRATESSAVAEVASSAVVEVASSADLAGMASSADFTGFVDSCEVFEMEYGDGVLARVTVMGFVMTLLR